MTDVEKPLGRTLEVRELAKSYRGERVVDSLSFSVEAGEFFTLLGPSGCGKTTVLMAVAGFVSPDAGRILVGGRDVTDLPPHRRDLGVVFQSYALFPHLSVLSNVMFPLRIRGVAFDEAQRSARRALQMVELDQTSDASTQQLSGGQRQRVALARALVYRPPILLMDEPLSALDRRLRETMQFELRRLQAQLRTTVLYVTHDQEEALALSDRVAVLRQGHFEQSGLPIDVYARPATSFVAGFLGESNSFQGKVLGRHDGLVKISAEHVDTEFLLPAENVLSPEGHYIIRPEHIRFSQSGTKGTDDQTIPGRLLDVAFLGNHVRCEVEVFHGDRWTVRRAAQDYLLEQAKEMGDTVQLAWDRRLARLVPMTRNA